MNLSIKKTKNEEDTRSQSKRGLGMGVLKLFVIWSLKFLKIALFLLEFKEVL
jgi:hypothetical protein